MDGGRTDEQIAADFRTWIDLPADATPEQMWAARPARVAVHRRLRAEPDPIEFIETLLKSAPDAHSMTILCEVINDAIWGKHTQTLQAVFDRSGDEPWATLSLHVFGSGEVEGIPDSQINLAQAIEAYVWMGGDLEPDESRESRYCFATTARVYERISSGDVDPVPLLSLLRRAAQTESEVDHVVIGAFEAACYRFPKQRGRIIAIAPAEYAELLRSLST